MVGRLVLESNFPSIQREDKESKAGRCEFLPFSNGAACCSVRAVEGKGNKVPAVDCEWLLVANQPPTLSCTSSSDYPVPTLLFILILMPDKQRDKKSTKR